METKYARRGLRIASLAGALLFTGACFVPSLSEMPNACDADHPCADGWVCSAVDGKCHEKGKEPAPPECEVAQVRPCEQSYAEVGECKLGTQTCGADRRWAECAGAVGPSTEVCDTKDNDCDGKTDGADTELVTVACPKQQGVCAGSQKACVEGVQQDCDDATSYGPDYMADESLCKGDAATDHATCTGRLGCDGKDNDCDGATDEGFDDYDHDLYGDLGTLTKCTKNPNGAPYDCNDADPSVNPGAAEVCDGRNNDCSGGPDDATSPVEMACVWGSFTTTCPNPPDGSALGNCSANCANACDTPVDICNGVDDDGDGVTDKADELLSGPGTLAGTNTLASSLTKMPEGGFLAGFVRQVSNRTFVGLQRITGRISNGKPEVGAVIEVATLAGSARQVAVTPHHLVWLDTVDGHVGIKAVGISKGLAVGPVFTVFSASEEVESLSAAVLDEGETVVAAGVPGAGSFILVRVLSGGRAIQPATSAQISGGAVARPSFGTTAAGLVVFYEADGTVSWRSISGQGDVGATASSISPAPTAGTTYVLPSGSANAVAYVKKTATSTQVEVVRVTDAGQVGAPQVASDTSTTATKPSLAALKSGTDYVYSLGYVDASARFLNLEWTGSWQLTQFTGFTMSNLQQVVTAGDGTRFLLGYQGQSTSGFDTQLRYNCFFDF